MAIELESMKYFRQAEDSQTADGMPENAEGIPQVTLPAEPAPHARRSAPKPNRRHGWSSGLTWICVFFAFISFTGFISAGFGIAGLFVEPVKGDYSELDYTARTRIEALEASAIETRQKYSVVLAYVQLMKLGLAIGFGVSVLLLVTRSPRGRSFAFALCALALFYHVSNTAVNIMVMDPSSLFSFVSDSMNDAAVEQGVSAEEREEMMTQLQTALLGGMIFTIAVILLIKSVFYGLIMMHLQQPEIKRIFGDDTLSSVECASVPAV